MKVTAWITHHKFWSSVLALLILGWLLSLLNVVSALGYGRIVGWYIFIGSIIWAARAKKLRWTILAYVCLVVAIVVVSLITY